MKVTTRTLMVCGLAALPCAAYGQSHVDAPNETVLAGPKVNAHAQAKTLIERDETGRVRRLDIPPAEAALKLLDLDQAAKDKTQAILDKRDAILDKIVKENLLLLVNLANARKSGDSAAAREALRDLAAKAEPLRERGSLLEELLGVLSPEQGAELKRLVQEYARAIVAEADRSMPDDTMTPDAEKGARRGYRSSMGRAAQAEYMAAIGRELKRSYERVVTAAAKDFDDLLKELDLAPEQEAEIRRIAADHFQKTAGNPTKKQKGEVFAEIYSNLNAVQRQKLLDHVRGEKQN